MPISRTWPVQNFTTLMALLSLIAGCATSPLTRPVQAPVNNPTVVTSFNTDQSWERVVESINDFHFQIEKEDRLAGTIETKYKAGASVFEPWHPDAVTHEDRLEGTFQSIRRRVLVSVQPSAQNSLQIEVQVFKELEDLPGLAANSPGGATFQESTPLQRDLKQVVGQSAPSQWIPRGRDTRLEQVIMTHIISRIGK